MLMHYIELIEEKRIIIKCFYQIKIFLSWAVNWNPTIISFIAFNFDVLMKKRKMIITEALRYSSLSILTYLRGVIISL